MPDNIDPDLPADLDFYRWMAPVTVDGVLRYTTPWGDPMVYEFPFDLMFPDADEAHAVLADFDGAADAAKEEGWVLIHYTGTIVDTTPAEAPAPLIPNPCPGSGGPSINGFPDNVDRWGTCPQCGATVTGSARIMAEHVESTSAADKANLADVRNARWMVVDNIGRAVTSSYADRAAAADAKAKLPPGRNGPHRIRRDVIAESAIAAGITDPNA